MRIRRSLAGLTAILCPFAVGAAATFDARLVSASYEIETPFSGETESEGSGLEFRGRFDFTPSFFGRASYLQTSSDELEFNGIDISGDLDSDILKLGVGFQSTTDSARLYGVVEFAEIRLERGTDEPDDDGFIVSGGISDTGEGAFLWNVELGIVRLSDTDGSVFAFDIGYRVNPTVAIVLGGLGYGLEDDRDVEYVLGHGTLGVRLTF